MENDLIHLFEKTIPAENHDMIPMPLVCDFFGINYKSEYKNLSNSNLYQSNLLNKTNEAVFGDKVARGHLDRKGFIRWISKFNPVAYLIDVMRMFILKGSGFGNVTRHFSIIIGFAMFFNVWAVLNYRKSN